MLDKVLRRSDAVDKESLCILAGQRVRLSSSLHLRVLRNLSPAQVWQLRLTIHFLADAGNLLDCACLAGIVALKHFRRPDVELIGDEVTVVSLSPSNTHSLYVLSNNDTYTFCSTPHRRVHLSRYRSTTRPSVSPSPSSPTRRHPRYSTRRS
jgi:exosome complex RNA-binding protein Rrp42 (RNase PH superfamily)